MKIVGVLKPTGTADDRALFMNIEGFYLMPGHSLGPQDEEADANSKETAEEKKAREDKEEEEEHAQEQELDKQLAAGTAKPLPTAKREVTSILVLCNSPLGPQYLDFKVNKGKGRIAQSVAPAARLRCCSIVLWADSRGVVGADGASSDCGGHQHFGEHLNSMTERSHDIAVMRALGESQGGDGHHLGGIDFAFTGWRFDWHFVGAWRDWPGEPVCGRANGNCTEFAGV